MSFEGIEGNKQHRYVSRHLDTVGDGSGTEDMSVNGSTTPVIFKINPPAGETYQLSRLMFYISDNGSFDTGNWGNGITMTNGIEIRYVQNGVDYSLINGHPIKTSGDLGALMYDLTHHNFGQGAEFLLARWTFNKTGQNIRLIGDNGDYLYIKINDNLTGLVEQKVVAQGFIEEYKY